MIKYIKQFKNWLFKPYNRRLTEIPKSIKPKLTPPPQKKPININVVLYMKETIKKEEYEKDIIDDINNYFI
ncbi:MAG: hypothetical protein WC346_15385 [Methanogenium sp.]|jgi:hypothetical protein